MNQSLSITESFCISQEVNRRHPTTAARSFTLLLRVSTQYSYKNILKAAQKPEAAPPLRLHGDKQMRRTLSRHYSGASSSAAGEPANSQRAAHLKINTAQHPTPLDSIVSALFCQRGRVYAMMYVCIACAAAAVCEQERNNGSVVGRFLDNQPLPDTQDPAPAATPPPHSPTKVLQRVLACR